jgi:CheY-like chemotaxis protein
LIVNDNTSSTTALLATLSAAGHVTIAAPSPAETMEMLLEAHDSGRPFDVLIANYQLGATTGIELCEALDQHEGFARLPRLLLVTSTDRPEYTELERVHVTRTMTRPVPPWELRDALESLSRAGPREEARPLVPASTRRATLRILLAEDNAINARLALRLLEKLGHEVVHVTDGQLAIDALGRAPFDAVLMDMQMPRLYGLEATRRIRATEAVGHHLPIIALTANAMKGDDQLCFAAGMDGYLTKPIDLGRLKDELTRNTTSARATGT